MIYTHENTIPQNNFTDTMTRWEFF